MRTFISESVGIDGADMNVHRSGDDDRATKAGAFFVFAFAERVVRPVDDDDDDEGTSLAGCLVMVA